MSENDLRSSSGERAEPEILVNELGAAKDGTVVVEEASRTVLLTEDETVIIDKDPGSPPLHSDRPRKVYSGMWGTTELVVFGLALLSLLGVWHSICSMSGLRRPIWRTAVHRHKVLRPI